MKSKKRHQSSSEESEQSDDSVNSSSSSESDSEDTSESEHRHKKKRKRANPSNSDSASEDQRRSKKRKHKKKKKKHSKKKRRSHSEDLSASDDELSSISDGEISPKKKRKHKHKHYKRNRSLPDSDIEEVRGDRRLHSVVKERRDSSEGSQPSRTYYQKEYPREEYERQREVQRFYRGSSKEPRHHHQEPPYYERERNDRYGSYPQEKYDRNKEKYDSHNTHYNVPNEDFNRRQQEFDQYKRHQRYNEHRYQEEYPRRPREDNNHQREDTRGYRYNQYEGQKRRDYDDGREYRDRRGPPENVNYRERAYPDKREKYRDEGQSQERPREPPRRERPTRPDKPPPPPPQRGHSRGHSRSRSPDNRLRGKRSEVRNEREGSRPLRDRPREERPREERPREERPREDRRPPAAENKPRERKTRFGDANEKEYSWGKEEVKKEGQKDSADKEKPNFGLSGKLTAEQNTVNGVVIKYSEPDDAKQPKRRWRFYPFKGDKAMPILYIHRQSAFLIGRDKKVADITLDHPSISKQHAALQYRATPFTRPDGSQGRRVRPYVIDLESANGTFVNNKKIDPRRYVELLERDVVKFGFSQREYVLLHENSKDEAQDDDHIDPPDIGDSVTTTDQIKQEKRVKQELAEDGE